MHLLLSIGYCVLVSEYLSHVFVQAEGVFGFVSASDSQVLFGPIEILDIELVESIFGFVKVYMLNWLQWHIVSNIHIDVELAPTLYAFLIVVADLCVAGAHHMEVQIIGVPPSQRKVKLPNLCLVSV